MAQKDQSGAEPRLDPGQVVIADLGSMSRKRIRRLKKGKGKGWKEVSRAVADIQADGHGDRTLVVLVRESSPIDKLSDLLPF